MTQRVYVVPNITFDSLGRFDTARFIRQMLGHGEDYIRCLPTDRWMTEINLLLDHLKPIQRFVIEARMRGKTLRYIADMVGWAGTSSARQVEDKAFRMLRHPTRSPVITNLIKEYAKLNFCEWEQTDETYIYTFKVAEGIRDRVTFNYDRCKICGRRDDEGSKSPLCVAKNVAKVVDYKHT